MFDAFKARCSAATAVVKHHLRFLANASKRQLAVGGLVVAILGTTGMVLNAEYGAFLDLTESRCMPEVLYFGYPRSEVIQAGEIVSFIADKEMMFGLMAGKRIAKLVAAVPGDHVVSNEAGVWVNGLQVGGRNPVSVANIAKAGKRSVNLDRVLQPGELFVVGTLPRSFDSRYWGILQEARVDKLMKAVI